MPFKWENGSCEIIFRAAPVGGYLTKVTNETTDAGYFSKDEFPEELIGWQYHQAIDALSSKKGIVAVLDARLSLNQFRDIESRMKDGEEGAKQEWFYEVLSVPDRVDLNGGA